VDDLDGTVDDTTRIYSMAGGMKRPAVTSEELGRLIRSKGRMPVERDSEYQRIIHA
jgi:aminodeoxyfutalosine synthase